MDENGAGHHPNRMNPRWPNGGRRCCRCRASSLLRSADVCTSFGLHGFPFGHAFAAFSRMHNARLGWPRSPLGAQNDTPASRRPGGQLIAAVKEVTELVVAVGHLTNPRGAGDALEFRQALAQFAAAQR